jgi:hypothetical protein
LLSQNGVGSSSENFHLGLKRKHGALNWRLGPSLAMIKLARIALFRDWYQPP